jgi:hypothetical protein
MLWSCDAVRCETGPPALLETPVDQNLAKTLQEEVVRPIWELESG